MRQLDLFPRLPQTAAQRKESIRRRSGRQRPIERKAEQLTIGEE